MAVTSKVFYAAITSLANKEIDWGTDTIKVSLHSSSYTPSQSTHDYWNDATGEVTGTGYTAGGYTLTTKTESFSSNVKQFDAGDVTWATSTISAAYAVIYDQVSVTTSSLNPLIAYVDFGGTVTSSGGNFTITWDSTGVFTVTVS
jgi:hypothetical protein